MCRTGFTAGCLEALARFNVDLKHIHHSLASKAVFLGGRDYNKKTLSIRNVEFPDHHDFAIQQSAKQISLLEVMVTVLAQEV